MSSPSQDAKLGISLEELSVFLKIYILLSDLPYNKKGHFLQITKANLLRLAPAIIKTDFSPSFKVRAEQSRDVFSLLLDLFCLWYQPCFVAKYQRDFQLSQLHSLTRVNVEKGAARIDSALVAGAADLCLEQLVSQSVSCFEKKK